MNNNLLEFVLDDIAIAEAIAEVEKELKTKNSQSDPSAAQSFFFVVGYILFGIFTAYTIKKYILGN